MVGLWRTECWSAWSLFAESFKTPNSELKCCSYHFSDQAGLGFGPPELAYTGKGWHGVFEKKESPKKHWNNPKDMSWTHGFEFLCGFLISISVHIIWVLLYQSHSFCVFICILPRSSYFLDYFSVSVYLDYAVCSPPLCSCFCSPCSPV